MTEVNVLQEWGEWWGQNWPWAFPVILAVMSPLIEAGTQVIYDYCKGKGWIK